VGIYKGYGTTDELLHNFVFYEIWQQKFQQKKNNFFVAFDPILGVSCANKEL
jgi:hypothetical protein